MRSKGKTDVMLATSSSHKDLSEQVQYLPAVVKAVSVQNLPVSHAATTGSCDVQLHMMLLDMR